MNGGSALRVGTMPLDAAQPRIDAGARGMLFEIWAGPSERDLVLVAGVPQTFGPYGGMDLPTLLRYLPFRVPFAAAAVRPIALPAEGGGYLYIEPLPASIVLKRNGRAVTNIDTRPIAPAAPKYRPLGRRFPVTPSDPDPSCDVRLAHWQSSVAMRLPVRTQQILRNQYQGCVANSVTRPHARTVPRLTDSLGGRPLAFAGVDAGECDAPLKITWPSDVENFKARLDPLFTATDTAVRGCFQMAPADRTAWQDFFAVWRSWMSKPVGIFGSHGEWVETCGFARTLDAWRTKIAAVNCAIVGPDEIEGNQKTIDLLKYGILGGVALAGAGLAIAFLPELKGALAGLRR